MRSKMFRYHVWLSIWVSLMLLASGTAVADQPDWVAAMRKVHAAGQGESGILLNLGDSITYSMAYFAPLQHVADAKMPPAVRAALQTVNRHMKPECYRWKGGDRGNASGQTAAWALKNADRWLEALRPEVAVIMFGTNDIRRGSVEDHEKNLRALVTRLLDRGVVVILSTIPPMHGFEDKVQQTVQRQRQVATEMNVPLIDLYAHIVNRRPHDWNGKLPRFGSYGQWEVPTLISKDGVHLSNPKPWRDDYTEEGLGRNGNVLRNYLTLMAYAEVIDVVVQERPASSVSKTILGANPPAPTKLPDIGMAPVGKEHLKFPGSPPHQDWFPQAPPLAKPSGQVIKAGSVAEIYAAASQIGPGGSILIAHGHYRLPSTLRIETDNVTLRGSSDDRTQVVLDFSDSQHHEGIAISHCSGVTIANLTVSNVRQNGIKINSNLGVDGVTIHNVISHNVWQRHVKGPKVPDVDGCPAFAEKCRIQYCLFYNDRPKQRGDDPWEDANPRMGFNYIGGIDVMSAKNWVISDNVFTKIHGRSGAARGAIFLWHNTTDCVIERNMILDCDSGICLGNSSARNARRHANGCLVRNNFVVRCPENNILVDHTRDCKILNNSVHDPEGPLNRLLRVVHANHGLLVTNNIFSGPRIVIENHEGEIDVRNNLIRSVPEYFVDAQQGNLHLTSQARDAIGMGTVRSDVVDDIDCQSRTNSPDLGADQRQPTPPDSISPTSP